VRSFKLAPCVFKIYSELLAICRHSGCTVASGVVGVVVVVVGICNRSQMRTSKCTCLIFGMSIGVVCKLLDLGHAVLGHAELGYRVSQVQQFAYYS